MSSHIETIINGYKKLLDEYVKEGNHPDHFIEHMKNTVGFRWTHLEQDIVPVLVDMKKSQIAMNKP